MTEMEELKSKFKLICKKCGSENTVVDMVEPTGPYSEVTGGDAGWLSIGCNGCMKNDFYWYIPSF
jgi:predicted nucleic-acid-binding Zn-ribbon protein